VQLHRCIGSAACSILSSMCGRRILLRGSLKTLCLVNLRKEHHYIGRKEYKSRFAFCKKIKEISRKEKYARGEVCETFCQETGNISNLSNLCITNYCFFFIPVNNIACVASHCVKK